MQQVHILNGDALKHQFPDSIGGTLIVARECMIEGPVKGQSIEDIFDSRKQFFKTIGVSSEEYRHKTEKEFEKIYRLNPKEDHEINLWFEDDLFCQANMWFVLKILEYYKLSDRLYLVRPGTSLELGFSGLGRNGLIEAFNSRYLITSSEFESLQKLWSLYQEEEHDKMIEIAHDLGTSYTFLEPAILADKGKRSTDEKMGRPEKSLRQLIDKYGKDDFASIFRSFHKTESIYGYGDSQVKRLLESII
ncbi:MAG: DUF1835 domain-containing protein [Bacteroidia bacterium]|nr:DUF1835 domain-containing protein [Bacteroidia bacterium]